MASSNGHIGRSGAAATVKLEPTIGAALGRGLAIPAHPLALTAERKLDERRQRALSRYYIAAGAGGMAVGVHTTQFAIRDPQVGLYAPVLELAAEEMDRGDAGRAEPLVRVAGVAGVTGQAVREAQQARELGYHAALVSLKALGERSTGELVEHCRAVGEVIPIIGFYLQTAVGGRYLPYEFWRELANLPCLAAIKMAPFNRYRTLDVVRAIVDAGRDDVALYTGNDDNIVGDLLTPYRMMTQTGVVERRIVGGLLGHWAVWTRTAVKLLEQCRRIAEAKAPTPREMMRRQVEVTDMNAAVFDAANGFKGVIAGVHEVLRRQGLLEGTWCLDPNETLGPGQSEELDRVQRSYPHLIDDAFVAEHRDVWLRG